MTRYYALARLLEHGPLTPKQVEAITRWSATCVDDTLRALREAGVVTREPTRDGRVPAYALTEGASA